MDLAPNEIETYLASQPENVRVILEKMRQTIKDAVPEAVELNSYRMPAFKFHGMLAWYAPFKNHYSLFVPKVLPDFKDELKQYTLSKGGIRFPLDHPVPVDLVTKIIQYCARVNLENAQLKRGRKSDQ
jgi:uncharacterized protein YdhG (YjbR/CyaY superfamily)